LFTEKVPSLGTEGDISLLDLSTYVVGLRSGMRFDTSIHVAFATDELLSRIIERHDGQSLWNEPLTLADGVTTVSPVVTLADRLV
jgi:HK97 family phage major capsid protein